MACSNFFTFPIIRCSGVVPLGGYPLLWKNSASLDPISPKMLRDVDGRTLIIEPLAGRSPCMPTAENRSSSIHNPSQSGNWAKLESLIILSSNQGFHSGVSFKKLDSVSFTLHPVPLVL
jgi:hypothetical protein